MSMILRFVDFRRAVGNISRWEEHAEERAISQRIMVLGGEEDVISDPKQMRRLAQDLRQCVPGTENVEKFDEGLYVEERDRGVRLVLVHGAQHHFLNDVQRFADVGVQRLQDFLQQL